MHGLAAGPTPLIGKCVLTCLRASVAGAIMLAAAATAWSDDASRSMPSQAIADLVDGNVQTHIDLPQRHPFVYAMRHEFLDALIAECGPSNGLGDLAMSRELMDNVMFAYATYGDPELGDLSNTSIAEAYAAILANPLSKLYPAHLIRLDLAPNAESIASEVVANLGGCDSADTKALRDNLGAIAVMGPLVSRQTTFLKAEINPEAGRLNCFYANPNRPDYELFQPYELATPESVALFILPWSAHLGPYEFLPRTACPATPDPAFGVMETFIHPEVDETALQGDLAERLATAFLDQYIPAYAVRSDGTPALLEPSLRARYFAEVVRLERIEVSPEDVERELADRLAKASATNGPPQSLDTVSIELDLRLEQYEREYGNALSNVIAEAVAAVGDRNASYLLARAYSGFFDDID